MNVTVTSFFIFLLQYLRQWWYGKMNGSRCLSDNECRNSAQVIIEMSKFGKVTADIEGYTFYWTRCRWLFWNWQAFLCCTGSVLKLTVGMQWQFVVAESVLRVTTYLENLEMSGNFTAVRKMSGNWGSKSGIVGGGGSCPVNSLLLSSSLWLQQCLVDWSELL